MRKKVYIVNYSCHDLSAAKGFGDLVVMTKGFYNQLATGKMFRAFGEKLENSNPEDYIVPCGRRIMSNIACAMFASMHNRLNLLIWIPPKKMKTSDEMVPGRYKERIILMEDLDGIQGQDYKA